MSAVIDLPPLIKVRKHLENELQNNVGGLNIRQVRQPEPPSQGNELELQIYIDEEEFDSFGFNHRFKSTVTFFLDFWHPFVNTEEVEAPAIVAAQRVKRFISTIINKKPPSFGENEAWVQMVVDRIQYQNPFPDIKAYDFCRLEVEAEYSEVIQPSR